MSIASYKEYLDAYSHLYAQDRLLPLKLGLFDKQKAFRRSISKKKAAVCSRRSGKTHEVSVELLEPIEDMIHGDAGYITLTNKTAKKIMFNHIKRLNRQLKLGYEFNSQELSVTNPITMNTLYCGGANTEDEAEKFRGFKFKRIVLDEVASFRAHVDYMISDVLEPTLVDLNGDLILIGTPSANPGDNYFYKATTGSIKGFDVHHWTILDNPYIPNAANWLKKRKEDNGWTEDHPTYMREWRGLWCLNTDTLVYKYDPALNHFVDKEPHVKKWHHVIGCDIGYNDAFTINVWAFSYDSPNLYSVYELKKSNLIPSQMAEILKQIIQDYRPVKTVADCGGLGKAIVEEFNQRYGLAIEPAQKVNKPAYIELMNGDLRAGRAKIKQDSELAKEMRVHQWHPEKKDKEDDRTQNDLCFAAGTRITLGNGATTNIEDLQLGEMILTREGPRKLLHKYITPNKNVYKYSFDSGAVLWATPNHPIWSETTQSFKALRDFYPGETALELSALNTMDICGEYIQIAKDLIISAISIVKSEMAQNHFIGMCSKSLKALSRMAFRCTTKTRTQQIIALPTSKLSRQLRTMRKLMRAKLVGINLKLVRLGTAVTARKILTSKKHIFVQFVPSSMGREKAAETRFTAAHRPAELKGVKVYNLLIEDHHEYFANGILVHNCDAALYSYREAKHFMGKETEADPLPGTKEHNDKIEKEIEDYQLKQLKKRETDEWWED